MTAFPAWMYGDPAEVAERKEISEQRALERRGRMRELERGDAIRQAGQTMQRCMAGLSERVILAPPEIRMKRLRIQALARKGMRDGK